MTGPDTAADLTAVAASIDEQLADETADRQYIAESASARIKDITPQLLGAAELEDAGKLNAIRGVLAAFDWERDDRQYALERIEQIAGVGRPAPGTGPAAIAPADLGMVLAALEDAAGWREMRGMSTCLDCAESPVELCPEHAGDLEAAASYRMLARTLGEDR